MDPGDPAMPVILKVTQTNVASDASGLASITPSAGEFSAPVEVDVSVNAGTMAFLDAIRGMGNLHKINILHQPWAFGTMVAKRSRVVESPSRPHCIQFSLSLL